jgi:hypothetical protein
MPKDEQFGEWIWDHYAYLSGISDRSIFTTLDLGIRRTADTLKVDARLVNDVSVTPRRQDYGVITPRRRLEPEERHRFLDTSDPCIPKFFFTPATVTGGVHSAYINAHYVYLTDDATGSMQ